MTFEIRVRKDPPYLIDPDKWSGWREFHQKKEALRDGDGGTDVRESEPAEKCLNANEN